MAFIRQHPYLWLIGCLGLGVVLSVLMAQLPDPWGLVALFALIVASLIFGWGALLDLKHQQFELQRLLMHLEDEERG